MAEPQYCCQNLGGLTESKSPFQRIISFDYHDGATAGAAQCAVCAGAYKYDMVDWDQNQDVRVFGFAPLPPDSFMKLTALCAALENPKWPIWSPKWQFSTEVLRNSIETEIEQILGAAGPHEFVLASRDLAQEIIACRDLTEIDGKDLQTRSSRREAHSQRDWFQYLGLQRS